MRSASSVYRLDIARASCLFQALTNSSTCWRMASSRGPLDLLGVIIRLLGEFTGRLLLDGGVAKCVTYFKIKVQSRGARDRLHDSGHLRLRCMAGCQPAADC